MTDRTLSSNPNTTPGGSIGAQSPSQADGAIHDRRELVGPLNWTVEQFVDDGLATCRDQIAIKVGKDREGWIKDEWYWLEIQRRLRNKPTAHETNSAPLFPPMEPWPRSLGEQCPQYWGRVERRCQLPEGHEAPCHFCVPSYAIRTDIPIDGPALKASAAHRCKEGGQ